MPRRIANALTLLSAVVCVLSAMVVGRSFFTSDGVWVRTGHQASGVVTAKARLHLFRHNRSGSKPFWFKYGSGDTAQLEVFWIIAA